MHDKIDKKFIELSIALNVIKKMKFMQKMGKTGFNCLTLYYYLLVLDIKSILHSFVVWINTGKN